MNFRQLLTVTGLFSISFSNSSHAQTEYANKRLTLRSDFPAKTVMVSNINQQVGEKSPFLIAAARKENGDQKEYRSLLQFNYDYLPAAIMQDPTMIASAELILYPTNSDLLANNYDEPAKLVVKRIVENWNDSITGWDNLPLVDSLEVAQQKVKVNRKNREISIIVTSLVKDMILYGNNGFMICQSNIQTDNRLNGLSFASSVNNDTLVRPLLVIKYWDASSAPLDMSPQPDMKRARELYRSQRPPASSGSSTGGSGGN